MAKNTNYQINSGLLTFRFTDTDGSLITSFQMNPSDVNLLDRCEKCSEELEKLVKDINKATDSKEMIYINKEIEQKIDFLLGMEENTVFKPPMTATTILPDGTLFCELILDKVLTALEPEIKKRSQKMKDSINKYTKKYSK